MHLRGFCQNHILHVPAGSVVDHRTAFLDDPCFFSGNQRVRVSQILRMVQADRRDHAHQRFFNHIRSVEPPSQAGFQHRVFHPVFVEQIHSHQEQKFKKGRMGKSIRTLLKERMHRLHHGLESFQEQLVRNHFLVHLKPFVDHRQMRGGKKSGLLARRFQDRGQVRANAAFPIGSRHMDQLHAAVGAAQPLQHRPCIIQRILFRKLWHIQNVCHRFFVIHVMPPAVPDAL